MYLLYVCIYWLCTPETSSISSGFSGIHLYRKIKYLSIYRLRRPISKICMVLLMDAKIWMTSLIIMFAVRPTCVQDSLFKMSSESPEEESLEDSVAGLSGLDGFNLPTPTQFFLPTPSPPPFFWGVGGCTPHPKFRFYPLPHTHLPSAATHFSLKKTTATPPPPH